MNPLFPSEENINTDLYELTMAAVYFQSTVQEKLRGDTV